MTSGTIFQINTSRGGVPKLPIASATVGELGIAGDEQAEQFVHGGPSRALCLYALEVIEQFAADGHPIAAGSVGENITTEGLDWARVVPGTRLRLGSEVRIEITGYTTPCKKNARWFSDGNFNRMNQKVAPVRSRVYAKVLHGGTLRPGDPVAIEGQAPGFSQGVPVLHVRDVAASLGHYRRVFGFAEIFRWGEPPVYGRVQRGGVTIDLASASAAVVGITVSDVEAVWAELKANGAGLLGEPERQAYGRKDFNLRDPDGNILAIGGDV